MTQFNIEEPSSHLKTTRSRLRKWPIRKWVQDPLFGLVLGVIIILLILLVVYWAVWANLSPEWTGFGPYDVEKSGPRAKTLWDWLDLLIVPTVLAFAAYWLNRTQKRTELKIADEQRKEEKQIAHEQRKVDLQIAGDSQRQATLEGYFDRMTDLLLNHDLRAKVTVNDEERTIARARTLAVLRSLDGVRKGLVVRFLHEAGLIKASKEDTGNAEAVLVLNSADLSQAILIGADLRGADLSDTNLYKAELEGANLREANLRGVNLEEAKLGKADLSEAHLEVANLSRADLRGADLRVTQLFEANLMNVKLDMAYLGAANLRGANLEGAILTDSYLQANLTLANLTGAILTGADLSGADLTMAKLCAADLRDAKLHDVNLNGAKYDKETMWPERFDFHSAGCIPVESRSPNPLRNNKSG